ncbi:biorientation of chromosomes in cell division protein 1-like 1 [Pseudomyrmex gracilis]|uniref:biorientation of chromosomes in cell division protein 1-like 1 n=1 Tax=Pseudomyrmex gracilis TaxID=219809 RepID=UPI000995AC0A|nr:biorientation of chromosomes in cell division protein 1-like 1 [Pseudomyrmex gracilis]
MELSLPNTVLAGDSRLIDHIVGEVKSQGIFDQFRKECIADVDTKPAYQNLRTRVEGSVNSFLSKQIWKPDLNKNQLRETLRKHIHDEPYLDAGVERIVDQVVNPKVYSVFMSQIEDVVYKFLGIERPKTKEKNGACGLKDLLPKDLDPVSPESDKNSLKDVSLESVENDTLEEKQEDKMYGEQKPLGEEACQDQKNTSENGHLSSEEKTDETGKTLKTGSNLNLNTSGKSDDKMDEEEEEVSPTFEPIDIMNLNESNISNDSHLSGISELTSHRSRSPDFSNDLSRDNFDCSNQDSQLSKVSSDSRLSIVTDFGSNHGLITPAHDSSKEETKDKYEVKSSSKDNFKAIREESSKNKSSKSSSFDFSKSKETQDYKESRDSKSTKSTSSKESSRDASDSGIKDKYEHKSSREKSKDNDFGKSSKSTKEKVSSKEKYYKEKTNERKKSSSSSHSSTKYYDKHSKSKPKDKIDQAKEISDKSKDISESCKDNASKIKEEKEIDKKDGINKDKKDNVNKEVKDLKDLYKEKIRELREKKELTEKEKLNKDKEIKLTKESKDKKDSFKDKKPSKKEHRSSSSSSSSKTVSASHHESKSSKSEKTTDGKDKKSDSKDRTKRDEKRLSRDGKSKTHYTSRTDLSEKSDKSDSKKSSKSDKDDKSGKMDVKKDAKAVSGEKTTNGKKDTKNHVQRSKSSDRSEKSDGKRDSKNDNSSSKDKKRKEDKKSKTKDDHSSLRKNSNDRRSSDRDGSNGSNNKTSSANTSYSNVTSHKSNTSGLTKDNVVSNSSSETSDSIEEMQLNESRSSLHQSNCKISHSQTGSQLSTQDKSNSKPEISNADETSDRLKAKEEEREEKVNLGETKKRSLSDKDSESNPDDVKIKKPKFAKNIHEAKKLMKLRKQMEKQKSRDNSKLVEKKGAQETEQTSQSSAAKDGDNLKDMPDDERVQIIEIPDEEYEEPYPEKHEPSLKFDDSSIMVLGTESCTNDFLNKRPDLKPTLSKMELRIKESLSEIVTNMPSEDGQNSTLDANIVQSHNSPRQCSGSSTRLEDSQEIKEVDDSENKFKNKIESKDVVVDKEHCLQVEKTRVSETSTDFVDHDKNTKQSTEGDLAEARESKVVDARVDVVEEMRNDSRSEIRVDDRFQDKKDEVEVPSSKIGAAKVSSSNEDNEDCRYFKTDNEQSEKFSNFLESVELENSSLEDIIESLGGRVVTSIPQSMAAPPPMLHERSSSLLSNILANNTNNNNDSSGLKRTLSSSLNEDAVQVVKKRKFIKKPRLSSTCNTQGISNGENFVMPLSPDSDVSATSEKTASSTVIKEEKSRNRSSHQRYSSDDLYKPRPLFSSSSRRSRRANQA